MLWNKEREQLFPHLNYPVRWKSLPWLWFTMSKRGNAHVIKAAWSWALHFGSLISRHQFLQYILEYENNFSFFILSHDSHYRDVNFIWGLFESCNDIVVRRWPLLLSSLVDSKAICRCDMVTIPTFSEGKIYVSPTKFFSTKHWGLGYFLYLSSTFLQRWS